MKWLDYTTNIFPACVLCIIVTSGFGQALPRETFRAQVREALEANNVDLIHELFTAQRGEALRFIEALLDSAILRKAGEDATTGQKDWQTAKDLAGVYAQIFDDPYYRERALRYSAFNSAAVVQKAELIRTKARARQTLRQGNFRAALEMFHQTLAGAIQIGDVDDEATLIGNIGVAHFFLGAFDSALVYYQESLNLLEKIGDQRRVGNQLGNIANVYSDKSDYPTAIEYFEKAMVIRRVLNDQRGLGADLNNLGLVHEEMGAYDKALAHYQQALAINKSIANQRSMGRNLANIANIQINLGDYPQAIEIYEEALALRRSEGDRKGEGNDLGNLGLVYQALADYTRAMELFQQALSIHRELEFREGEGYQLGRIANLYSLRGEYAKAIQGFQEALEIHRELGHVRGEANWLEALGVAFTAVGDRQRALETLQSALELHRRIENKSGEAATLAKIGRAYLETEDARAKDHFERALGMHRELGEKPGAITDLASLAYIYSVEEDSARTVATYKEAMALAAKLADRRLQAWLQLQLGDFYRDNGERQDAVKAYELGLALSEALNDPELRWNLYYGQGQLWESQSDLERVFFSYQAAVDIIEDIRGKAVAEELKAGVLHQRFEVYEAIISVLMRLGRVTEALEYVERSRARNLVDLMGNAKISGRDSTDQKLIEKERALRARISKLNLQLGETSHQQQLQLRETANEVYRRSLQEAQRDYQRVLLDLKLRNPEYMALMGVEPLSSKQMQKLVKKDGALLEYFFTAESMLIFVVTPNAVKVVTVPEGEASLRGKIVLFRGTAVRQMNEGRLAERHWVAPMQGLYQLLIEPVDMAGHLSGIKHLVIVPQGVLHYLPFQALVTRTDSQGPHFLVEDYAISYSPSASTLKFCQRKNTGRSGSLLLLAPRTDVLPSSQEEVTQIANSFGQGSKYYMNKSATETLFKQQAGSYDLLHIATTAEFNKANPIFSRLDLAGSDQDDGRLEVHEVLGLRLNANLVTLSGCQTALGSGYSEALPRGEDLVSLTRAFHYAGTPSVIASLWEVSDPSTAAFMERFYQYLREVDKAQALAQTQRDMIAGALGNPNSDRVDYAHPFFWAAFILVGDWN